ncbi:hypothetical protein TNIN_200011 [Trichonephila inaurata madagascariensis]|uniref:Uncharacterized protein n=1 Tax=Trichonephila inaurata madagascariensis TaxID=2747483 RepID=A0A8X7CNZ5_9ARAC|nr:hypothetical protein TNIN_200011 [Trichonephila inaurata madagascariensis]
MTADVCSDARTVVVSSIRSDPNHIRPRTFLASVACPRPLLSNKNLRESETKTLQLVTDKTKGYSHFSIY